MRVSQRAVLITVSLLAVAVAIGYLDYLTGLYVSLTLLYLVPLVAASWNAGRSSGVIVAIGAGMSSLSSDVLLLPTQNGAPIVWNALSRTLVLSIAAVAVDQIHRDRDRLRLLDVQRGRALELLDRGLAVPARQLAELAAHWDGSADKLRAMLQPRAEEIAFMARDFSSMIRLQGGNYRCSSTPSTWWSSSRNCGSSRRMYAGSRLLGRPAHFRCARIAPGCGSASSRSSARGGRTMRCRCRSADVASAPNS